MKRLFDFLAIILIMLIFMEVDICNANKVNSIWDQRNMTAEQADLKLHDLEMKYRDLFNANQNDLEWPDLMDGLYRLITLCQVMWNERPKHGTRIYCGAKRYPIIKRVSIPSSAFQVSFLKLDGQSNLPANILACSCEHRLDRKPSVRIMDPINVYVTPFNDSDYFKLTEYDIDDRLLKIVDYISNINYDSLSLVPFPNVDSYFSQPPEFAN